MRKLHRKLAFVTLILLGASVALVQGSSGSAQPPAGKKRRPTPSMFVPAWARSRARV